VFAEGPVCGGNSSEHELGWRHAGFAPTSSSPTRSLRRRSRKALAPSSASIPCCVKPVESAQGRVIVQNFKTGATMLDRSALVSSSGRRLHPRGQFPGHRYRRQTCGIHPDLDFLRAGYRRNHATAEHLLGRRGLHDLHEELTA
jgi:hypothetical protein